MRKALWVACLTGLCAFVAAAQNGSLVDPSFNPGTGANGLVETVLALPDGKILICGNFTSFNGVDRANIARLNHDGSVDTSFHADTGYWVRHMSVQGDGKIVIGGFFTSVEGQPRNRVARLNANGTLDPSFNPGSGAFGTLGVSITGNADPFVFFTAIQPGDGKILITGNFTNYNGTVINGIARLNPDGSLDTTFNTGGGLSTWGRSIQVLPNNKILVTGWFDNYHNGGHHRMALINPDGSPDSSLNPFFGDKTAIYTAVLLSSGKYIVAGHSENPLGMFLQDIARINPDGSFDTTFNPSANDKVEMVRVQADGKIVMGGYFNQVNGELRRSVARLNADGSLDPNFHADFDNFVWSIALTSDGKTLASGGFTTVDGQPRSGIVRLLASAGSAPPPPPPPPVDTIKPVVQITSPAPGVSRVTSSTIVLSGTARDAGGIQSVSVSLQGGTAGSVAGTTNWSAPLNLAEGTNVISVTARDGAGNETTISRTLVYVTSGVLSVVVNGSGTVVPNLDGQALVVGHSYHVTARPAAGAVFAGWSGGVDSSAPGLTFVMRDGLQLQANFVPNPFTPHVGNYNGLFVSSDNSAATSGAISLSVSPQGNFSGRILSSALTRGFSGRFDSQLAAQVTLPRPGGTPVVLDLHLGDDTVTGTAGDGTFSSPLLAYRAGFSGIQPATNFTGRYNVLFPGGPSRPVAGHGFGTVIVGRPGNVRLQGVLADGTPFETGANLSRNGVAPIYFSRRGQMTVFGWLTIAADSGDVSGNLHWERSTTPRTTALSENLSIVGSEYAGGGGVDQWNSPVLVLQNGDLAAPIELPFVWNARHQAVFGEPNDPHATLSLDAMGRVSGSFVSPVTQRRVAFRGVVVQGHTYGGGFFISSGASGSAFVGQSGGPGIPTD